MIATLGGLLGKLWADDCGSIITTEYLMLGTVLALGSVSGLTALRDASVQEMQEYGNTVRSISQSYRLAAQQNGLASKGGSATTDLAPQFGAQQTYGAMESSLFSQSP